jgi:hypothetical protein
VQTEVKKGNDFVVPLEMPVLITNDLRTQMRNLGQGMAPLFSLPTLVLVPLIYSLTDFLATRFR